MCGRYRIKRIDLIEAALRAQPQSTFEEFSELKIRFNAAPSQRLPIVRATKDGPRQLSMVQWGLIPSWAKAMPKLKPINARAETIQSGGTFREPFARRRCLVPADGFYEWKGAKPPKQPYLIHRSDDALFAFAGIWDRWRSSKDAEPIETFAISTTTPNEVASKVHSRMPVILSPDDYETWLDDTTDADSLQALLRPYAGELEAYPVSPRVNSPKNDAAACAEPLKDPGELEWGRGA